MERFVIFILFSVFSYQLSAIDNSAYYYESAIHIADSLYKNYMPQSNFKDVKDFAEKAAEEAKKLQEQMAAFL